MALANEWLPVRVVVPLFENETVLPFALKLPPETVHVLPVTLIVLAGAVNAPAVSLNFVVMVMLEVPPVKVPPLIVMVGTVIKEPLWLKVPLLNANVLETVTELVEPVTVPV